MNNVDVRISLPREGFGISRWADVHLQVLSLVDTAAIPLHLVVGPSFDVFTLNENTKSWLSDQLLHCSQSEDAERQQLCRWWKNKYGKSDVALLLQVDGEIKTPHCGARVTELLIYAGLPRYGDQADVGMLTPPRSSSPTVEHEGLPKDFEGSIQTVNIYALPLSTELFCGLQDSLGPLSPSSEETIHEHGQFIPSSTEDRPHHKGRKRLHLDSLFQDATHQVKRSKKRGGESIAKAMASFDSLHSQTVEQPMSYVGTAGCDTQVSSSLFFGKPRLQQTNGLSRAHSLGSLRDLGEIRPPSRGNAVPARRSTLSRLASVGMFESSSPVPESLNSIEQQNKAALSRVVMAGMRMYGLQQRRKSDRSRAASEIPPSAGFVATAASIPDDEDEYKLVYHQTHRAASFAFRKYMPVVNIGQDRMRDVVDRILEMFCVDLLTKPKAIGTVQQSFEAEVVQGNNPFDPSSLSEQACE
ncbi:hypothetical protein MMC27_003112 [Xylographa pallens]|nr:hypothetical protein [Xylographa pallens]